MSWDEDYKCDVVEDEAVLDHMPCETDDMKCIIEENQTQPPKDKVLKS